MRLRLTGTIGEIVAILGLMARYEAEDKAAILAILKRRAERGERGR